MGFGTKRKSNAFAKRYQAALREYLTRGPAANLQPAVRLGRKAVALGMETLDLALIHEQALITYELPAASSAVRDRLLKRAGVFFAEAMLPLEGTHRSALESNAQLMRLNRDLQRRTIELVSSNRRLKDEISKRKDVEQTLRSSERDSRQLLVQSQRLQEQLRHLSRQILVTQEGERKRISRELHDVIAQVLTEINMRLGRLRAKAALNTKGLSRSIANTQKLVAKSVDIVHRFAYDLRPAVLDFVGLIPALQTHLKNFMKETGIRVGLTVYEGLEELESAKRIVFFRVAQEALANVARHAQASRVDVSFKPLPKGVCMKIADNGRSFDVTRTLNGGKSKRMGLLGMRERVEMVGGSLAVESSPGKGTTIEAELPFQNKTAKHTP